ncbi:MAG: glycosyltransferase [Anaerolineae bacterium]|nr:glycosyltransferase [Anaerolineae bacterium]
MKLLVVCASLDLTQPFSATPAWWQLLKAFYEIGVEVIATPYQGPAIESLWWRAEPNPAKWQGDAFKWARDSARRLLGQPSAMPTTAAAPDESATEKLIRRTVQTLITPVWAAHLDRILRREPDIDAVLILTAPMNHLVGIAAEIQSRHRKPVFYYDGDMPASLPSMSGFASGFRIYQGADPAEYTAVISNSQGGEAALKALGAKAVHTVFYGADPDVFSPVEVAAQDIDVLFYGHGREYRSQWVEDMLAEPSRSLPEARFAARGKNLGDLGRTALLPYLSFSKLREYACRSKLNLCITRQAHASVPASSSSRPFELASMGCCIVSNPYAGIETWFEPGKELIVVHSREEALDRYRTLLNHDSERRAIAQAARARLLAEHTFRHRARQFVDIFRAYL